LLAAFSLLAAGILLGPLALWWSRVNPMCRNTGQGLLA